MRHSHAHRKHSRPSSRATNDSRPRPLQIPNRRSDVRSLIDFFNNRAFKGDGKSTVPRRPHDPIPENKVKSLVVNFNRLESFSSPTSGQTTVQASPIRPRFGWREKTESILERTVLAGKRINVINFNVQPEGKEVSPKKPAEPLRSVKARKEQYDPRMEEGQSVDQAKEKKKRDHHHHRSHHHKDKSLKPIVPAGGVDGPTASADATGRSPDTKPPSRNEERSSPIARLPSRTDKRGRIYDLKSNSPNDESELYFSSHSLKTSPVLSLKTDKDTPQPPRSKSSASALPLKPPTLSPKPPALRYVPAVPPARDANLQATTQDSNKMDRLSRQLPKLGVANGSQTELSSPRKAGPGMVKGVVALFGAASRSDTVPSKERITVQIPRPPTRFYGRDQSNEAQRSRVPAEYDESSSGSSSLESENSGQPNAIDAQFRRSPMIVTTEASPLATKAASWNEKDQNRDILATSTSYGHLPSTVRQPRTFKDIALQRREDRKKVVQPSPQIFPAPQDRRSVPPLISPLRVVKMQGPDVSTLQNPVPLQQLYSKASQDTLTSFEEPSILVSGSSASSSEEDVPPPPLVRPQRLVVESQRVRSTRSPILPPQTEYRPPMRSPSLMREMALPRLSLRAPSVKLAKSIKQAPEATSKPRSKRPVISQDHFTVTAPDHHTPRMKLKKDDEWRDKWRQRLKNNIDGPNDSRELLRHSRRHKPRPISSSSRETILSSKIVSEKRRILPLETQTESEPEFESEPQSSVVENRRRHSDYTLVSSAQAQRSRVNFSSFTQNFPAAEYSNIRGEQKQRIGDRTTAFDGVQDVVKAKGIAGVRVSAQAMAGDGNEGVLKGIQKHNKTRIRKRKTKKAARDRPSGIVG